MQFAMLIYEIAGGFRGREKRWDRPVHGRVARLLQGYGRGRLYVGGDPLQVPDTGTTIRIKDGKRHVQDGPYADSKEQLGDSQFWRFPRLTQPWSGLRGARQLRTEPWRFAHLHLA
jgi:hypothetical protein